MPAEAMTTQVSTRPGQDQRTDVSPRAGPPGRWAHVLRALLALALGCVLAALLSELGLRAVLFGLPPSLANLARALRRPELYTAAREESLYWKLQYLWGPPEERIPRARNPDPLLGWRSRAVRADYSHVDMEALGSRRPILLYGDSFAMCVTADDDCFQGLVRSSDLGADHALLNYGVGGYGIDQAYLSLRASIGHFDGLDPIVVFSFLVEDDLNRTLLDFRQWPKPELRVEEGEIVVDPPPVLDSDAFLALRPPRAASWSWRLLVHSSRRFPRALTGQDARDEQKGRITRAVLEAVQAELDSHGLEWFVLLFHSDRGTRSRRPFGWDEPFVVRTLAELGIPFVSTRPDIWRAAADLGVTVDDLYRGPHERGFGHLDERGNRAAFESLRRGLRGEFDSADTIYRVRDGGQASQR
jgi:hypothetical protein